ncbi:MAG: dipeptidyl-peptidase 3 family protein, partial [Bacteroidales bacterium]
MLKLRKTMALMTACAAVLAACQQRSGEKTTNDTDTFEWKVDQFADIKILRYQIPEFEQLTLKQKIFLYYLSEAALSGRDIIWDQNCKYNLLVRNYLENIYRTYKGDRQSDNFHQFLIYLKRVWFSNGIHHHYSTDKIQPGFSQEYFKQLIDGSEKANFPIWPSLTAQQTFDLVNKVIFDPDFLSKRVNLDPSKDLVLSSANNFYEGVTQHEAESFYNRMKDPKDATPISYGLNSKLIKKDGKITEQVWKSGGMYGKAIDQIIFWLE